MKVSIQRANSAVHLIATNEQNISISMDGSPQIGGQDLGMRPMEVLLSSIAGCSSMDVLSILNKMKEGIEDYKVEVTGERDIDQVPAVFKTIHVHYILKGNLNPKNVEKAIHLSMDKYCSVSKMLEKSATITHSYEIIK
ncbi:MAG: OsmC family protein [Chitinophagales bacterium]|nr:OsmC family protein [Chitinophagales bacterium]MCZ2394865.1 OsmC family protein [Chitinophagales bacterium]